MVISFAPGSFLGVPHYIGSNAQCFFKFNKGLGYAVTHFTFDHPYHFTLPRTINSTTQCFRFHLFGDLGLRRTHMLG
jgi:hypothetical protein